MSEEMVESNLLMHMSKKIFTIEFWIAKYRKENRYE